MSVNRLLSALVAELEAGDVPAPLTQSFGLAALWCDLARLAGEAPPADVAALVEGGRVELPDTIQPWHFFEEPFAAALADRYPDELDAKMSPQWDGGRGDYEARAYLARQRAALVELHRPRRRPRT